MEGSYEGLERHWRYVSEGASERRPPASNSHEVAQQLQRMAGVLRQATLPSAFMTMKIVAFVIHSGNLFGRVEPPY